MYLAFPCCSFHLKYCPLVKQFAQIHITKEAASSQLACTHGCFQWKTSRGPASAVSWRVSNQSCLRWLHMHGKGSSKEPAQASLLQYSALGELSREGALKYMWGSSRVGEGELFKKLPKGVCVYIHVPSQTWASPSLPYSQENNHWIVVGVSFQPLCSEKSPEVI